MNNNSSFEDEYFIVLKPKGDVLNLAKYLQDELSSQYELYPEGKHPEIHITLDRIIKDKVEEAIQILENMILKYSKIDILVENFDCYSFKDNNFLVLNVQKNEKLVQFSHELHERLAQENISTIKNYEDWKFHISLASTVFSEKKHNFDEQFQELCFRFQGIQTPRKCKADVIEIWRPTLEEDKKVIKKFQL